MKGSLAECIDYIQAANSKTMLLLVDGQFEAVRLTSIKADRATPDIIVGVFKSNVSAEVVLYEAG